MVASVVYVENGVVRGIAIRKTHADFVLHTELGECLVWITGDGVCQAARSGELPPLLPRRLMTPT